MLTRFQEATKTLRTFTALIAFTLVFSVFTTPAFAAGVEVIEEQSAAYKVMSVERISTNLSDVQRILENIEQSRYSEENLPKALVKLEELKAAIEADEALVLEQFNVQKAQLQGKKLHGTIIQRHNDMVKHFRAHKHTKLKEIDATIRQHGGNVVSRAWYRVTSAFDSNDTAVEPSPISDVDAKQFKRHHQPKNPDFLPTNTLKPNPDNTPKMDKADFTLSKLRSTPTQYYAALGDFSYDELAGASDPAYLGESDEIVLTDDIRAKAEELNYDAVAIYHWVRNNVEYIPSWGSVQSAQLTLETLRGNSIDIASLTIALLRASQIPARYVHGTISVPANEFMNWAGGFEDVMAAGTYAASAGLPFQYITTGGTISHLYMEHVWVEAATDYYPSRGARNLNADSWVQFDPSYKQYEYVEGIDTMNIAGIDAEALLNDIIASAEINETLGSISSMDTTVLETALFEAQSTLEGYIDTNMTDPTVLDVVGGKKTIIQEFPTLPSSLPNEVLVEGARYDKIPQALQQKVIISMDSPNVYDYTALLTGSSSANSVSFPYAKVNNERVTLSFRPATTADEETLASYLPDSNITDISQLPDSLPAYLINVVPELKVKGEVVLEGSSMRLGEEIDLSMQPYIPGYGSLPNEVHRSVAGSYLSLNVIAQSVSPEKLQDLEIKLENTKTILESGDEFQLSLLSREDIIGDMMYAGSLSYFAQLQGLTESSGYSANARGRVTAANGIFGYEPKVNYLFGLPQSISAGGIHLDIPINFVVRSLDNDNKKSADFAIQVGTIGSTLEHQVPEQMFNIDPANPVEAISAVKAMQIANAQGQNIYQIDQHNISEVLPRLNLSSDIISEIQYEVSRGKIVTTHTDNVSVPGWTGAGYIIVDPLTGEGAYMISGGENGAFALVSGAIALTFLAITAMVTPPILVGIGGHIGIAAILSAAVLFKVAAVALLTGNITVCQTAYKAAKKILFAIAGALMNKAPVWAGLFWLYKRYFKEDPCDVSA